MKNKTLKELHDEIGEAIKKHGPDCTRNGFDDGNIYINKGKSLVGVVTEDSELQVVIDPLNESITFLLSNGKSVSFQSVP